MFRLKPVYLFLLLAILLTSCDLFSQPTKTPEVVAEPTAEVTTEPTAEPTSEVTAEPTAEVTTEPTSEVTTEPTAEVTTEPTSEVTTEPTSEVTTEPTTEPTSEVTTEPTAEVTTEPTSEVTAEPTTEPTSEVTAEPTDEPTPEVTPPGVADTNCAISISGQSFYISGGGGGVTTEKQQGYVADWRNVNNVVNQAIAPLPPDVINDVAILIVDDFNGEIPSDVLGGSELAEADLITHRLSHGIMVYEHTINVLSNLFDGLYGSTGYTLTLSATSGIPGTDSAEFKLHPTSGVNHRVVVQQVPSAGPTSAYDTSEIEQNVRTTIGELQRTMNIYRFVVNMSFIILPCKTVREFESKLNEGVSFDQYVATILSNSSDPKIKNFGDWIRDQISKLTDIQNDPLLAYIQEVGPAGAIVFVAAAGNYGREISSPPGFWFYPGAWDEVINVSGNQFNESSMAWEWWPNSNLGDVTLPAAWYPYVIISNGKPPVATIYYYAGTSFAAPTTSVIAALYLSRTNPRSPESCPFNQFPPEFARLQARIPADVPDFVKVHRALNC